MAKTRKNEMTVSYTVKTPKGEIEKEHKIDWTFSTDPIKWSVETLHSFMYCGLTQATKAILRAKVLQEVPAVELFNSMKPALLAMASGSTNPDAFKIFVQTMKEQGHVMQEELTVKFTLSESDFTPGNPQLVQAEETEEEEEENMQESKLLKYLDTQEPLTSSQLDELDALVLSADKSVSAEIMSQACMVLAEGKEQGWTPKR